MKQSEIWVIENTFTWKDEPDREFEGAVAVFESEDLVLEWLREEAAYAESRGFDVTLYDPEGELYYETKYGINKFEPVLLPFYQEGSDD